MSGGWEEHEAPPPLFGPLLPEDRAIALRATIGLFEGHLPGRIAGTAGRPTEPDRRAEALAALVTVETGMAAEAVRPADLTRIAARLRGRLQESPFAALLATPSEPSAAGVIAEELVAWVLAAALVRMREAPRENAITAALRNTRLLIVQDPGLLARLAPLPTGLGALVAKVRALEESAGLPTRLRHRLAPIRYLLDRWNRSKPAIFRPGGEGNGEEERPVRRQREGDIVRLTGGFRTAPMMAEGTAAEQEAEAASGGDALVVVEDMGDLAPGPVLRRRTVRIARAVATRALALPAENDPMTAHEAARLVEVLTHDPAAPGAGHLLTSLAFGLPVETVLSARAAAVTARLRLSAGPDGRLALSLVHRLPDPELIEELRSRAAEECLVLLAPRDLTAGALQGPPAGTEILARLRPRLARPMTAGRIARYKSDWLRRAGADMAVIGFLTGVDPARRAQMHYTAAHRADLQDWHARYLGEALGLTVTRPEPGSPETSGAYGSGIRLDDDILRALFDEQRRRLRDLRTGPVAPLSRIAAAHNAFALYTLMLLYLATGHRPVSHPFELLSDIDLETGLVWIADKATGPGSRAALLPPVARAQVAAFRTHLLRLAEMLALPTPGLVTQRVRPAAVTAGPAGRTLFFFLGARGELREMTLQAQLAELADVFPIQLNWTRHTLRSRLLADRAAPQSIDALLGHSHLGEEPFASGSGFSMGDLRVLSLRIEAALQDWGVTPCETPLGAR